MRRIALLAALAATIGAGTLFAGAASAAYYSPCASVTYKGRAYKVFKHAMSCSPARTYSKRVLITRRKVSGWRCSLSNLNQGFGACARGSKAFSFVPRR